MGALLPKNENNQLGMICQPQKNQVTEHNRVHEIVLSKTHACPKGTYTKESTKFFTQLEKDLFFFVEEQNIAAIRYLTMRGIHINSLDEDRTSPLHIACKGGSLQLVEEVLNHGAMINIPDITGMTSLHIACYYKRPEIILILLKKGANLFTKDREGVYPYDLLQDDDGSCLEVINSYITFLENTSLEIEKIEEENDNEKYIREQQKKQMMISKKPLTQKSTKGRNNRDFNLQNRRNLSFNNIQHEINEEEDIHCLEDESTRVEEDKLRKQILDNYKFIPKKHKFFYNYQESLRENEIEKKSFTVKNVKNVKNSKISENTRLHKKDSNNLLIKMPKIFPETCNFKKMKSNANQNHIESPSPIKKSNTEILTYNSNNEKNSACSSFLYNNLTINSNNTNSNFNFRSNNQLYNNIFSPKNRIQEENLNSDSDNNSFELDSSMIRKSKDKNKEAIKKQTVFGNYSKRDTNHNSRNRSLLDRGKNLRSFRNIVKDQNYNLEEETVNLERDISSSQLQNDSFYLSEHNPGKINFNHIQMKNDDIIFNNIAFKQKIFIDPETDYFLNKINLKEIFISFFELNFEIFQSFLLSLIKIDYDLGMMLLLNIFGSENYIENVIEILRKKINNKELLTEIVHSAHSQEWRALSKEYFSSFDIQRLHLTAALKKILTSKHINI
jgi:hypothetical protein